MTPNDAASARRARPFTPFALLLAFAALVAAALSCVLGSSKGPDNQTSAMSAPSIPRGILALAPEMKPIPPRLLADDRVTGIVLRSGWPDIEAVHSTYDLRYLEEQLDKIGRAGKVASLVVTAGGLNSPAWLMARCRTSFRFEDDNRFRSTRGQQVEIPLFWDAVLLEHQRRLIAELGKRLSARQEVRVVSAQCANATTDDWHIPASPADLEAWVAAGFSEDRLFDACRATLEATMRAFPHQYVKLAVGRVPVPLAKDPDAVARRLIRFAETEFPGRLIVARHNLAVGTPVPGKDPQLFGWAVLKESPRRTAQFLWPASDVESCRLNQWERPCEARAMFDQTAKAGLAYGVSYIEVYGVDLINEGLTDAIRSSAIALSSAPAPPIGSARDVGPFGPLQRPGARPPGAQSRLTDGVSPREFVGSASGKTVRFVVALPPDYEQTDHRYPAIYWLHGKGGDAQRSSNVTQFFRRAVAQGKIGESILVFPEGGSASFYVDSPDGSWPIETMILKDLVPYIDREFRTVPQPSARFLMGFSMGGHGALRFAGRHPDVFGAVVAYGAPRLNLGPLAARMEAPEDRAQLQDTAADSPLQVFSDNKAAIVQHGLGVRLVAGGDDGTRFGIRQMHEYLEQLGIPHEYEELPGVRHVVPEYYLHEGDRGFAFLGAARD